MPEITEDEVEDGLDALHRIWLDGTKIHPNAKGFIFQKYDNDQTQYETTPYDCTCPSVKACKHRKIAKLLSEVLI